MTLKTLKDIKQIIIDVDKASKEFVSTILTGAIDKEELRELAIKWVIEDIKELRGQGPVSMNPRAWDLLKKWMKRLNITEEDLK